MPINEFIGGAAAKRATILARRSALPLLRRISPGRYTDAPPYRVLRIPTPMVTRMQRAWEGPIRLPWLTGSGPLNLAALRRRWHAGIVLDGDWDQAVVPFRDYHLTRVLESRFAEGREWLEISYIRRALKKVRAGEAAWGGRCRSEEEVWARCRYLDGLHARLASHGYRPELAGQRDSLAFTHFLVNIGRDGAIIRNNDGKHRIILSRILGIPVLQARVLVRHRAWQRIRERIRAGDQVLGHRFRDHPDLATPGTVGSSPG